jgi:hypothetical protein
MRLASIFALADRSAEIQDAHLDAALAIWDYSARSLRFIFPDDVDPKDEKLLKALEERPDMTKREIARDVFRNHLSTESLDSMLGRLLAYRMIEASEPKSTGGRPAVRYSRKRW